MVHILAESLLVMKWHDGKGCSHSEHRKQREGGAVDQVQPGLQRHAAID